MNEKIDPTNIMEKNRPCNGSNDLTFEFQTILLLRKRFELAYNFNSLRILRRMTTTHKCHTKKKKTQQAAIVTRTFEIKLPDTNRCVRILQNFIVHVVVCILRQRNRPFQVLFCVICGCHWEWTSDSTVNCTPIFSH